MADVGDVLETIGNALSAGTGADEDKVEAELAQDSDAVASPLPPEQVWLGRLLAWKKSEAGDAHTPSVAHRGLRALILVATGIGTTVWPHALAAMSGLEPNGGHYVAGCVWGLAVSY